MLSLIVLQGPGKGRVFRFAGDKPVVLGRQSGDLRLLDRKISRRHAEINFEGGTWVIRDLGSSNGTLVNARRIDQLTELEEGDQLTFGPFVLVVGEVTTKPPALGDTSLVDLDTMDHVMLSPHVPTAEQAPVDDDVMHVEPVPHAARPEQPAVLAGEEDAAAASIFDIPDEADEPAEASIADQEPVVRASAEEQGAQEQPVTVETDLPLPSPEALLDESAEMPVPSEADLQATLDDFGQLSEESDEYSAMQVSSEVESPDDAEASAEIESLIEIDDSADIETPAAIEASDDVEVPAADAGTTNAVQENPFELFDAYVADAEARSRAQAAGQSAPPAAEEDDASQPPPTSVMESDEALVQSPPDAPLDDGLDEVIDDTRPQEAWVERSAAARKEPVEQHSTPPSPAAALEDVTIDFEEEPQPEPAPVAAASSSIGDDHLEAPRTLGRARSKPRILWPLTVAGVLLIATGAGSGIYLMTAGKSDANIARHPTAGAPSAPAPVDRTTAVAVAPAVLKPTPSDRPLLPAHRPDEPVNPVTMSMFDDGPLLMPDEAFDPPPPPAPTPASPPPPQPSPQPAAVEMTRPSPPVAPAEPITVVPPTVAPSPPSAPAALDLPPLDPLHVAYLVDASGSLVDALPQVLAWLDESIRQIDPRLEYTVIFFRAGQVIEVPPAGLKDARDRQVNRDVRRWIAWEAGNVTPGGRSDPRQAIERALAYSAGQVYILSDGRAGDRLSDEQVADFMMDLDARVAGQKFAIHSVQFFDPEMRGLLAYLSRRYPGERQFIEPPPVPTGEPLEGLSAVPN